MKGARFRGKEQIPIYLGRTGQKADGIRDLPSPLLTIMGQPGAQ